MKPSHWLLPALAAVTTASLIFSQKHLAATLTQEISVITERVRQARTAESSTDAVKTHSSKTPATTPGKIDWRTLAKNASNHSSGNDMRSALRTQRILMGLSADALVAQLDEIDALDLDLKARDELRRMILEPLSKKDPQRALESSRDQLNQNDGFSWTLSNAFTLWAQKDGTAALAWLDKQIAAGAFESKSLEIGRSQQTPFEVAALKWLMDASPDQAESRLAALPASQREEILNSSLIQNVSGQKLETYTALIRRQLDTEKAARVLAGGAQMCAHFGGIEKVDDYIATIHATPDETTEIVKQTINTQLGRKLSEDQNPKEELEKTRAWATRYAPSVVDASIGSAIAHVLWQNPNFEKTAEMILDYHATSQNDDALVSFLHEAGSNPKFRESSIELASKIKDPSRREEVLQSLSPERNAQP